MLTPALTLPVPYRLLHLPPSSQSSRAASRSFDCQPVDPLPLLVRFLRGRRRPRPRSGRAAAPAAAVGGGPIVGALGLL